MKGTVIRWHGGKHYLAKEIIGIMPKHTRYLEAFGGGLSVLLRKDGDGVSEYANDLHGHLINFWQVIAHESMFKQFKRIIEATPFSEVAWNEANTKMQKRIKFPIQRIGKVQWAVNFFINNRQSRQGLGDCYATPTSRTRRGMNENVSSWLATIEGLPEIHERLKRVEIWQRKAIDAIKKVDGPDTLVYADPPYVHGTRSTTGEYQHEMTNSDHVELLVALDEMEGKFILSGYRCPLYDHFAENHDWNRIDIQKPNSASSSKSKEIKTESLWTNF